MAKCCPRCGTPIGDNNFCSNCGSQLKEAQIAVDDKKTVKRKALGSIIWNLMITLIAVGALFLLWYFSKRFF